VLAGSVLIKQPRFARLVASQLRKLWGNAIVTPLERESAWGAAALAAGRFKVALKPSSPTADRPATVVDPALAALAVSPTEQRNPRSRNLDKLSLEKAVSLMLSEDARIPYIILKDRAKIARVVQMIVRAFKRGGRLFYVGAGTSGRLGILDASECPPTFRTPPEMVQGIIAGGQRAIWSAVEGAEDDSAAGAHALEFRGVNRKDVVVGIAASGRTPFVWGALHEARKRGAGTVLVCFNPTMRTLGRKGPDVVIAPNVGPEILTGSTRLKAGTASKLILNIFTTLAMVRLGKVVGNLMVDLNPSNVKLRDRAVRIVRELTGASAERAQAALEKSGWVVKDAVKRARRL